MLNLIALALAGIGLREPVAERVARLRRRAAWCVVGVVFTSSAGVAGCAWQAYAALRSDSGVDPGAKARVLAESISNAMNFAAAALVFTPVPLAAAIGLFFRGRRLRR